LLQYVKIFARINPIDKTRIISTYQAFGKIVAMCGNGANDFSSLRQADISLSLS
jgi:Mg2+-importing ATPase